jgi:hypothetical protein
MKMVCRPSGTLRLLVLSTALLLVGCGTGSSPPLPGGPVAGSPMTGVPESVAVMFRTDPVTGRSDGPFDPDSGSRVETHIGDDGIMRVVIDPATNLPRLLPDKAMGPSAQP